MVSEDPHNIQALQREVHAARQELSRLSDDVRDLVHAWQAAKGIVRAVRVIGSVAAGLAAIWAFVKFSVSFNWTK